MSERVLVILGMKGLGDAVEALPVFELVKRHWPDATVDAGYFAEPLASVLATSPHVARLLRLRGNAQDPRASLPQLAHNIRAMRGHDAVLFLYKRETIAWPLILAARISGARPLYRHGYRYRNVRRNALSDFPQHVFFQLVTAELLLDRPLGAVIPPRLALPADARRYAESLWTRHGLGGRPVALLNTRAPAYEAMGRWGLDRFARVADVLNRWGADVLLNGGLRDQVREYDALPERDRDRMTLIQGHSLLELAAVIGRCDLFIGEPSGPTLLARAVGTPTLSLQGPGDRRYPGQDRLGGVWWPQDAMHPRLSKVDWCVRTCGAACSCSLPDPPHRVKRVVKRVGVWDEYKAIRKRLGPARSRVERSVPRFPCLDAITVDEVAAAAIGLLERRPREKSPDMPAPDRARAAAVG